LGIKSKDAKEFFIIPNQKKKTKKKIRKSGDFLAKPALGNIVCNLKTIIIVDTSPKCLN